MLAYVFWHWPSPEADSKSYESSLIGFHRSLADMKPEGFHDSVVFRLDGTRWIETQSGAYEDWYLIEGSFALDLLNEAAVAGLRKEVHDRVARKAAGGTAGLYRLRSREPHLEEARFAAWFGKPRGTSYEEFYAQLRPWTDQPGVILWQRQMALGPTPEFCLLAPTQLDLPAELAALTLRLNPVWP